MSVTVTQADRDATKQHQHRFLAEGRSETELLREAFAAHREQAVRDTEAQIVAWLRSGAMFAATDLEVATTTIEQGAYKQ